MAALEAATATPTVSAAGGEEVMVAEVATAGEANAEDGEETAAGMDEEIEEAIVAEDIRVEVGAAEVEAVVVAHVKNCTIFECSRCGMLPPISCEMKELQSLC